MDVESENSTLEMSTVVYNEHKPALNWLIGNWGGRQRGKYMDSTLQVLQASIPCNCETHSPLIMLFALKLTDLNIIQIYVVLMRHFLHFSKAPKSTSIELNQLGIPFSKVLPFPKSIMISTKQFYNITFEIN